MSGPRRQAREAAVQILFELDLGGADLEAVLQQFRGGRSPSEVKAFAERLVRDAWARREEIDARIQESAEHWRLDRMAAVDRNVLRLAIYELLRETDVPVKAAINEAVELAKRFGGENSGRFVNGVLGTVAQRVDAEARRPASGSRRQR